MAPLSQRVGNSFVKLLYLGDSGTGKTGSLISLVKAGYKLRVLDMDNGIDILQGLILDQCPELIDTVDSESTRDSFLMTQSGPIVKGTAKAYVEANKLLSKWSDGSEPAEWGPEYILVLDSLTHFSNAAFEWAKGLNPSAKEPRQWYGTAQNSVENTLSLLTSPNFHAHVIVIAHVRYTDDENTPTKGYPNSIGKALGPIIPTYFNNMIQAEMIGSGANAKRHIKLVPTGVIDLKTARPSKLKENLPLETGMATVFAGLSSTPTESK